MAVSFIQRTQAAKAAGYPSWKALQREQQQHAKYGTTPQPPSTPFMGGSAPANAAAPTTSDGDGDGDAMRCGPCEVDDGGLDGTAAARAGFRPGNETTHGLSTEALREKLAAVGVGIRMASASDFTGRS